MKNKLLLSASFIFTVLFSTAQDAARTYAITGKANNNFFWADIKQVNITTGKINKVLFEADKTPFKITNIDKSSENFKAGIEQAPTGFGVAACALDIRHNRLYFATMHYADIRYLDLDKPEANFTTVKKNVIAAPSHSNSQPEENQITRMVIGADGYGYALSNDANHLIRFSTGRKPVIEDLGSLSDGENNKGISIHNKCTSWGGDMVADAFGKLVIISASHNVFNVDPKDKIANLAGSITGLPVNFTTNGAAVDNDGNLVVSSANVFDGLYKVNMKDYTTVKVESTEKAFNASDLANGNLLLQKQANDLVRYDIPKPFALQVSDGRIYPNPLSGTEFKILFEGQAPGRYTIILSDIAGRAFQSKVVSIYKSGQVETMRLASKAAKGMYIVKVLNENKELAFSEKMVIN